MDPRMMSGAGMMMPGAGMGMAGPGMGLNNMVFVTDPLAELQTATGAFVTQTPSVIQTMTGFALPNTYNVFVQTPMGMKYMFRAREYSSCCARCCCEGDSRPLTMEVKHIASLAEFQSNISKVYLTIDKPCKCSCFCCCRPYMDVRHVDTGKFFGRIREPFACCDLVTEVYDCTGNLRYTLNANCCQDGLCCGAACQKLMDIQFDILQGGAVVGRLCKVPADFAEFWSKADSYSVQFPPMATPEEKMLLIVAALMIDYSFFENEEDEGGMSAMQGY